MVNIEVEVFGEKFIRTLMNYTKIFSKISGKELEIGFKELKSIGRGIYEIKFKDENKLLIFTFIYNSKIGVSNKVLIDKDKLEFSVTKIRIYSEENKFYLAVLDLFKTLDLKYSGSQINILSNRSV